MREFIDAAVFKDIILCANAALEQNRQLINELNVFPVPDGDTGTNMSLTMGAAAAELSKKSFPTLGAAADCSVDRHISRCSTCAAVVSCRCRTF